MTYVIGLMSGTSADAVDGVLCHLEDDTFITCLAHASIEFNQTDRAKILALNVAGENELHQSELLANTLVRDYYHPVIQTLLKNTHLKNTDIAAIGAHGQTVRHQPRLHDGLGYTIQLNQPALLTCLSDIPVVADFRLMDIYAGGQGAPLLPAFHRYINHFHPQAQIFCNIGGMSNITVIKQNDAQIFGFDCGPGNVLSDMWIGIAHFEKNLRYDHQGQWACSGNCLPELLHLLQKHPYFSLPFPKSTGRDDFNWHMLEDALKTFKAKTGLTPQPQDVACTLLHLTAWAITQALKATSINSGDMYVYGGGAYNLFLLELIELYAPFCKIYTTDKISIHPQHMEAMAFAWLAYERLAERKIDLRSITGTKKSQRLGVIYKT